MALGHHISPFAVYIPNTLQWHTDISQECISKWFNTLLPALSVRRMSKWRKQNVIFALYKWRIAWEEILIAGGLKNAMNWMRYLAFGIDFVLGYWSIRKTTSCRLEFIPKYNPYEVQNIEYCNIRKLNTSSHKRSWKSNGKSNVFQPALDCIKRVPYNIQGV